MKTKAVKHWYLEDFNKKACVKCSKCEKEIGIKKVLVIKCNPTLFLLEVQKLPAQLNVLSLLQKNEEFKPLLLSPSTREEVFSSKLSTILKHSHYLQQD